MQVDEVRAWGGSYDWVPEEFRGKSGPFEVSLQMIDELSKIFDIAIMNHVQRQPSRAERARGAKSAPPRRVLWIDQLGGGFKTR